LIANESGLISNPGAPGRKAERAKKKRRFETTV
jgi:hypothetical protein